MAKEVTYEFVNVPVKRKRHFCKLPGFFRRLRIPTHTVVKCTVCEQLWILDYTASMIDDSRMWQKYRPEYYEKTYKLQPGEYPPTW